MKSVVLGLAFLSLFASPVWAGSFSLDFNDFSTQLGFNQNLNTETYGDSVIKLRYLYNDDSRTNLGGVAVGVIGTPGNVDGLKLGIDVALNGGATEANQEILALGLGFLAEYTPPALRGFGLDGHLIYSPRIFTFLDSENYIEWGVGVNYQVLPTARVTLAFQTIQIDLNNRNGFELDETVRFGISFDF
jgi:hypothetical protein